MIPTLQIINKTINKLVNVTKKLVIDWAVFPKPNLKEANKKNTYLQRIPKK